MADVTVNDLELDATVPFVLANRFGYARVLHFHGDPGRGGAVEFFFYDAAGDSYDAWTGHGLMPAATFCTISSLAEAHPRA